MGTFDHLQRKRTLTSTPAIQTPSLLRPSRQLAPLPPPQLGAPVTQAQPGCARPLEYSFDRISIFPPAKKNDTGLPDSLKKDLSAYQGDPSKREGISNDQGKSYYFEVAKHTGGFLPIMEAYELARTLNEEEKQGFDESKVKNVAREIELKQTIYPIQLKRTATELRLIQGRHRIAASLLKGLRTIPFNII